MAAEGDRNMYIWSIDNVHNYKCICWFLHKACLKARCGRLKNLKLHKQQTLALLPENEQCIIDCWTILNFLSSFPSVHKQLIDLRHVLSLRTSRSSLTRASENFVLWEFSPVRWSQRSRREPAGQELLSRLNIVARYSRQDSRQFTLTCNPALTFRNSADNWADRMLA